MFTESEGSKSRNCFFRLNICSFIQQIQSSLYTTCPKEETSDPFRYQILPSSPHRRLRLFSSNLVLEISTISSMSLLTLTSSYKGPQHSPDSLVPDDWTSTGQMIQPVPMGCFLPEIRIWDLESESYSHVTERQKLKFYWKYLFCPKENRIDT